ncbi:MAG TPA: hypothetical protein DIW46_08275 [Microbacterium sp.]|nr:hypothetical protein [Microbacterium sp.]
MYMSAEMITTLVGIVSMLLALAGGFGWMIHRIDGVESKLGSRIDKVADELVEVKVAIARIEGPPRHLVSAR